VKVAVREPSSCQQQVRTSHAEMPRRPLYRSALQLHTKKANSEPILFDIQSHRARRRVTKRQLVQLLALDNLDFRRGTCAASAGLIDVSPNSELTSVLLTDPVSTSSWLFLYSYMQSRGWAHTGQQRQSTAYRHANTLRAANSCCTQRVPVKTAVRGVGNKKYSHLGTLPCQKQALHLFRRHIEG